MKIAKCSLDLQILDEIRFGFLYPYRVAGMGEPWAMKMERTLKILKDVGIGAILTLTEDNLYGNIYKTAGFSHLHEPIEDARSPTIEGMDRAIAFIDSCLEEGLGIAVHCVEGRGRTGTVLGAWLGLKESLDPKSAIRRLFELRPHTILAQNQRSFLYQYLGNRG